MLGPDGKLTQHALGSLIEQGVTTGHMPAYAASAYPRKVVLTQHSNGLTPDGISGDGTCWAISGHVGSDEFESETGCDQSVFQHVASVLFILDPWSQQYDQIDAADAQCTYMCPYTAAVGYHGFDTGLSYMVTGKHWVDGPGEWYPYPAVTADTWTQCDGC